MSFWEVLRFAGLALGGHRLRAGLSLLAVSIGVAAVMLLTALGEGARRYVTGQFESLGTNLLIVIPGKVETSGALPGVGGAPNDLTLDDASALKREIPEVRRVVPVVIGSETVAHQERRRQVVIVGSTADLIPARRLSIIAGRSLPDIDPRRAAPVTILGQKIARELFPGQNPVGRVVRIGDWRMRVIGVLGPRGAQIGMDMDEIVLIPVGTGMRMFNRTSLFRILVEVRAYAGIEPTRLATIDILKDRHDEEDFTCLTQESVIGSLVDILAALTAALAGIAAVSLTVAGVGIMNVMLVSVSERTPEVGLLRALGATRRQVLALFLTEAALLSSLGGALGLGVGWLAAQAIRLAYPAFPVAAPLWAAVAALLVSLATGLVFGVVPALRATRLDPVASLQGR